MDDLVTRDAVSLRDMQGLTQLAQPIAERLRPIDDIDPATQARYAAELVRDHVVARTLVERANEEAAAAAEARQGVVAELGEGDVVGVLGGPGAWLFVAMWLWGCGAVGLWLVVSYPCCRLTYPITPPQPFSNGLSTRGSQSTATSWPGSTASLSKLKSAASSPLNKAATTTMTTGVGPRMVCLPWKPTRTGMRGCVPPSNRGSRSGVAGSRSRTCGTPRSWRW